MSLLAAPVAGHGRLGLFEFFCYQTDFGAFFFAARFHVGLPLTK